MITFGLYRLSFGDCDFKVWYGVWPKGYVEVANGYIAEGMLNVTYKLDSHKMPPRVMRELQKQFNPRINHGTKN